jgi:hypothetical protein
MNGSQIAQARHAATSGANQMLAQTMAPNVWHDAAGFGHQPNAPLLPYHVNYMDEIKE